MKIELNCLSIREVLEGYVDNQAEGVVAYGGKLDIRPAYQREFVYKDNQRKAVIESIKKGFPLNVMYWVENDQGKFEVLDGQQRTISIGQYIIGAFSIEESYKDEQGKTHTMPRNFHNLNDEEQNQILDYELMIYICEGSDRERLDWFRIINIAGEELTHQELRNAVYTGPWLSDAKLKFSKSNCAAHLKNKDKGSLLTGKTNRQKLLETTISWISEGSIEDYMAEHQHDENANELWQYYQDVIDWVRATFTNYREEMNGLAWGELYNQFKDTELDSKKLEKKIEKLMGDDDVTKKGGIYTYVLTGEEKHLNIRVFTDSMKRSAYTRQRGKCASGKSCQLPKNQKGKKLDLSEMEADHIKPWSKGGKTIPENCQMLCKECNRTKGSR